MKLRKLTTWFVPFAVLGLAIPAMAQDDDAVPTAEAVATPTDEGAAEATPTIRPLAASITVIGGAELKGTLLDAVELSIKTSFGNASIPLSEIAGVRMAQEDSLSTTVVLHNGDSITGATELQMVSIRTEWGKADVNAPNISSILFTQGLKWVSENGLNGTRWSLEETDEVAAANQEVQAGQVNTVVNTPNYAPVNNGYYRSR